MSYATQFFKRTEWKILETWDFSEGYFLAYCETTHLEEQKKFYVLFSGYMHMMIPDDIGNKLSGKTGGMENENM